MLRLMKFERFSFTQIINCSIFANYSFKMMLVAGSHCDGSDDDVELSTGVQ